MTAVAPKWGMLLKIGRAIWVGAVNVCPGSVRSDTINAITTRPDRRHVSCHYAMIDHRICIIIVRDPVTQQDLLIIWTHVAHQK